MNVDENNEKWTKSISKSKNRSRCFW
jgi:hypothetical protein